MGLGIGAGKGILSGANLGRAIVANGDFTAYVVQGEGEVLGFCSPFSQWEMPLGRRR